MSKPLYNGDHLGDPGRKSGLFWEVAAISRHRALHGLIVVAFLLFGGISIPDCTDN